MRKLFNGILYCIYLICTVLLLLEVCYRYQIIEFYDPELRALNAHEQLKNSGVKGAMLIAGDSFTAYDHNYGKQIQDSLPEFNLINTAVVGFSIVEASYLIPKRIAEFSPDIFIYQIYVGNDLMGIRHNLNGMEHHG